MDTAPANSLLRPGDPRWKQLDSDQNADAAARTRALTVAERLDRGMRMSRTAAELRRAAWEAQHGHPTT